MLCPVLVAIQQPPPLPLQPQEDLLLRALRFLDTMLQRDLSQKVCNLQLCVCVCGGGGGPA